MLTKATHAIIDCHVLVTDRQTDRQTDNASSVSDCEYLVIITITGAESVKHTTCQIEFLLTTANHYGLYTAGQRSTVQYSTAQHSSALFRQYTPTDKTVS